MQKFKSSWFNRNRLTAFFMDPVNILVTILSVGIITLFASHMIVYFMIDQQASQIVEKEFLMLAKSNRQYLETNNLRSFVASLGLDDKNYYFKSKDKRNAGFFESGNSFLMKSGQCAQFQYFSSNMTFCKDIQGQSVSLKVLSVGFLLFILSVLMLYFYFYSHLSNSIKHLIRITNLEVPAKASFSKLWSFVTGLADEINRHQKMLVEKERENLLTTTAVNLAHDIRSPLMAISAVASKLNPESAEFKLLSLATDRIKHMSDDLLLAKKKLKKAETEWLTAKQIKQILDNTLTEFSMIAPNIKIKIENKLIPNHLYFCGNSFQLQRIITNLLNNAIEHSTAESITIKLDLTPQSKLKITVSDNGCGIESKDLALITQGHSTKNSGNGIGLSSSIKALKEWAGDLTIKSAKGLGTEITVVLNSSPK